MSDDRTTSTDEPEFQIRRLLDAPREAVFDAWTDPRQLASWWGPHGLTAPEAEITVRPTPGGTWQTVLVSDDDGARYRMGGTYREVRRPERLVFTWGVTRDGQPVPETALITVLLAEAPGGRTELTLSQRGHHDPAAVAEMADGWETCLDRLTVSTGTGRPPGFGRHCAEISRQARQLRTALTGRDLNQSVPTCPGWTLRDLVSHLTGNLRAVGQAVAGSSTHWPEHGELTDAADRCADALRAAGPDQSVSVWGLAQDTADWARRGAFDLLLHRADTHLATAGATPDGTDFQVAPELAEDALAELLQLTAGQWQRTLAPGETVRLVANGDNGPAADWTLGGENPGRAAPEVTVTAPLTPLLLVCYRRLPPTAPDVTVSGDQDLLARWLKAVSLD